jgi:hypothetical protein
MFNELNAAFPDHNYFYEVVGLTLTDAMMSCARLTAGDPHVINYNGKIIFASQQSINTADINWLLDVYKEPEAPVLPSEPVE